MLYIQHDSFNGLALHLCVHWNLVVGLLLVVYRLMLPALPKYDNIEKKYSPSRAWKTGTFDIQKLKGNTRVPPKIYPIHLA